MENVKMSRKHMLKQSALMVIGASLARSARGAVPAKRKYPKNYPLPLMITDSSRGRLFDHVGVPTHLVQKNEIYVKETLVYVTDPRQDLNSIEWVRPLPGSPLPNRLISEPHLCYIVEDLDKEIRGKQLIAGPFEYIPGYVRAAFFDEDGLIIEAKQYLKPEQYDEFPLLAAAR